jgi:hypothetical protein
MLTISMSASGGEADNLMHALRSANDPKRINSVEALAFAVSNVTECATTGADIIMDETRVSPATP